MTFTLKSLNSLMLAGVLATVGASAMAQSPAATAAPAATMHQQAQPGHGHHMKGERDPAKMQARMAKHQAELKAKLKITASQEGAWTTFTAAMQPPAHVMGERDMAARHAEFAKLTTPERIDKMREMRSQRMTEMNAAMDKRGDAAKAFYAALSPEQKKTFDAETLKMGERHGWGGMRHHKG
ncbi:MAG: Spy/CpxP family protein refolding chaperone [Polaromonas sp.]